MNILLTGIAILIGIHLLPGIPILRNQLVTHLGLWPYKGLFAAIAFTGLVLVVIGKASADMVIIWNAPDWSQAIALAGMPISFILIVAAYLPSNIKRFTPHPMLWGVTIWAVVHLASNGDLASMILFGAIGVYALFDIWSANTRGAKESDIALAPAKDLIVIVLGLVMYICVLVFHESLSGVSVLL